MAAKWVCLMLLVFPAFAGGQDIPRVEIAGRVVDEVTGGPIGGAVVRLFGSALVAVADRAGRFSLSLPRAERYTLEAEQLGYATTYRTLVATDFDAFVTLRLGPRPLELTGLEVIVSGQFERRRFLSARPVTVVAASELAEKGGAGLELLRRVIPLTRLCYDASGELCFGVRDRKTMVSICIDEEPARGGSSDVDALQPWEIHSMELFNRGRHVRIYTRAFMQRVLNERLRLRPLSWCTGG